MMSAEGSIHIETPSAEATRDAAALVAGFARGGDLILLVGDLGAGKTVFAQGFASGLGIDDRVTSPTFALVQSYEGEMVMHHLDVYRLEHSSEVADLGLSELLDDDAVTLIEWGDMIVSALPSDFLEVNILAVESSALARETTSRVGDDGVDTSDGPTNPANPADTPDTPADTPDNPADTPDTSTDIVEEVLGRRIVMTARGPSWRSRMKAMGSALGSSQTRDGGDRC